MLCRVTVPAEPTAGPSSGEARRCGSSASARPREGGDTRVANPGRRPSSGSSDRRTLRGRVSDAALPHGSSTTCPGWSPPSDRAIPPWVCPPHKLMAVEVPRTLTCSVPWPQAYLLRTSGPRRALSSALRLRDQGGCLGRKVTTGDSVCETPDGTRQSSDATWTSKPSDNDP